MSPIELGARLALAIVVTLAAMHGMTRLVRRIRQPPVVGEIIAGLVLGPSLFGAIPGDPSRALFPPPVLDVLTTVGEIGVVVYLFLVGLDLGVAGFARARGSLATISLSTLLVPFALGALLALELHDAHRTAGGHPVHTLAFTLFLGTAFAMTAFPVLARILTDTGLHRDPLGTLAIRCAAILDAVGWMLLAVALTVATSSHVVALLRVALEAALFVAFLLVAIRPIVGRIVARALPSRGLPAPTIALVVAMTLGAAAVTNAIGLHPLLGAVLFGAIYPRRSNPASADALHAALAPVTNRALLPFFFLLPGLHVDLRHLGTGGIHEFALILIVACAGKFVGAAGATRACGHPWRDALVMGTLMNTRGLIELVVLGAGLSAHVLDSKLYGLMVLMALTTTMMTTPLLYVLYGAPLLHRHGHPGGATASSKPQPVSQRRDGTPKPEPPTEITHRGSPP